MPRFKGTSSEDVMFMKEWHEPGGHPCVPYMEKWEEKNKRNGEEYGAALDRAAKSPIKVRSEYKSEPKREYSEPIIRMSRNTRSNLIVALFVILLLIVSAILLTSPRAGTQTNANPTTIIPVNTNQSAVVSNKFESPIGCWITNVTNTYSNSTETIYLNSDGTGEDKLFAEITSPSYNGTNSVNYPGTWMYINGQVTLTTRIASGVTGQGNFTYTKLNNTEILMGGANGATVFHRCS